MIYSSETQTNFLGATLTFIRRMGLAGFSFFLIKGLLWLLVPMMAHSTLMN